MSSKLFVSYKADVDQLKTELRSRGIKFIFNYTNTSKKTPFRFRNEDDFNKAVDICQKLNLTHKVISEENVNSFAMPNNKIDDLISKVRKGGDPKSVLESTYKGIPFKGSKVSMVERIKFVHRALTKEFKEMIDQYSNPDSVPDEQQQQADIAKLQNVASAGGVEDENPDGTAPAVEDNGTAPIDELPMFDIDTHDDNEAGATKAAEENSDTIIDDPKNMKEPVTDSLDITGISDKDGFNAELEQLISKYGGVIKNPSGGKGGTGDAPVEGDDMDDDGMPMDEMDDEMMDVPKEGMYKEMADAIDDEEGDEVDDMKVKEGILIPFKNGKNIVNESTLAGLIMAAAHAYPATYGYTSNGMYGIRPKNVSEMTSDEIKNECLKVMNNKSYNVTPQVMDQIDNMIAAGNTSDDILNSFGLGSKA